MNKGIVVVTNVGSTTVTYMWKKVQRGDYIQSKSSDAVQRFYCHYVTIRKHAFLIMKIAQEYFEARRE